MLKEKSPGGNRGGAGMEIAVDYNHPQYSTDSRKIQSSLRALSDLLDQAISQAEHHEGRARYHAGQAAKHRAILRSLQGLIPKFQFTEGMTNER